MYYGNFKSYRTLEKIKNYSVVVIDGVDDDEIKLVRNIKNFEDINKQLVFINQLPSINNECEYIQANNLVRGWEVVAILKSAI